MLDVPDPLPFRGALLRHDLPDGSAHFDLLLQRQGGADLPLVTFRVESAIDSPDVLEFAARRIIDHRPVYLDYEGEIPGGRGHVRRVASGSCYIVQDDPGRFVAAVDWGLGMRVIEGVGGPDGSWLFTKHPA